MDYTVKKEFPRTTVDGLSLSRFIIGTNWMAGYSHRSDAADNMIKECHNRAETMLPMLDTFMENGIDTIMAPFGQLPHIVEAVKRTENGFIIERTGREPVIYNGEITDLKILRDGYFVEVFVNGGAEVYTALL